jgi:hypothetical protein
MGHHAPLEIIAKPVQKFVNTLAITHSFMYICFKYHDAGLIRGQHLTGDGGCRSLIIDSATWYQPV